MWCYYLFVDALELEIRKQKYAGFVKLLKMRTSQVITLHKRRIKRKLKPNKLYY